MNRIEAVALIMHEQCKERFHCTECSLSDCPYWYALQDMNRADTIARTDKIYYDPVDIIRKSEKHDLEWDDVFKMLEGGEN